MFFCGSLALANGAVTYNPEEILAQLSDDGFARLHSKFKQECPSESVADELAPMPAKVCRSSVSSIWTWVVLSLHQEAPDVKSIEARVENIKVALDRYQAHVESIAPYQESYQFSDLPMLAERDQLWEMVALSRIDERFYEGLSAKDNWYFALLSDAAKLAVYRDNQRILEKLVDEHSWPKISEYGKQISRNAWLIVQHADHDVRFQRKMLKQLKSLLAKKETSKRNYAYLYDRVLNNSEGKTLYGTQVTCKNQKYVPINVVEPEGLDARRAAHDLEPIEEYLKAMHEFSGGPCGPPE